MREGEELKAPRHASAAATRGHVTTRDIVPTLRIMWEFGNIYKSKDIDIKL